MMAPGHWGGSEGALEVDVLLQVAAQCEFVLACRCCQQQCSAIVCVCQLYTQTELLVQCQRGVQQVLVARMVVCCVLLR